ncbi:hypothetical protein Cgig2_014201 [Carnegiea gigantea]|uniref:Uncharacterized protein n=1 Tax=Carnegiea gigantea TaxID=171969 RepID=A0A9Q1JS97_9CARY|nr:hypothetical protein Cgig2_014201 [Carnegiea gigantea]
MSNVVAVGLEVDDDVLEGGAMEELDISLSNPDFELFSDDDGQSETDDEDISLLRETVINEKARRQKEIELEKAVGCSEEAGSSGNGGAVLDGLGDDDEDSDEIMSPNESEDDENEGNKKIARREFPKCNEKLGLEDVKLAEVNHRASDSSYAPSQLDRMIMIPTPQMRSEPILLAQDKATVLIPLIVATTQVGKTVANRGGTVVIIEQRLIVQPSRKKLKIRRNCSSN